MFFPRSTCSKDASFGSHQGRREAVTIEGGDPVELARRFRDEGARRLHLVDLDGAFNGTPTLGLVERVACRRASAPGRRRLPHREPIAARSQRVPTA